MTELVVSSKLMSIPSDVKEAEAHEILMSETKSGAELKLKEISAESKKKEKESIAPFTRINSEESPFPSMDNKAKKNK